MTSRVPDLEAWVAALAPVLRLEIAPAHLAGVKANLEVAQHMAALLENVEIDERVEPAPVFGA